ncbi:MAG: hypothetical protein ACI8W7_003080 [Gammaproteobacteria bacterium]|jgi:hypothetical protein
MLMRAHGRACHFNATRTLSQILEAVEKRLRYFDKFLLPVELFRGLFHEDGLVGPASRHLLK